MRRTILLVRHGETEWNRVRRYQGWSDSALTGRGVAQAEAIGHALKNLPEAASAALVANPYHMYAVTAWAGAEPALVGDEHTELRWFSSAQTGDVADLALEEYRPLLVDVLTD